MLEPLGLVLKAGVWYLVARNRGDVRTYRVSATSGRRRARRVVRATRRLRSHCVLVGVLGAVRGADAPHRGDCRLSPTGLAMLRRVLEPAAGHAAHAAAADGEPDAEGWVQLVMPLESAQVAYQELLRLGADIEVLAPAELRQRIIATARTMSRRYGAA